jgi:hypothetical protein
MTLAIKKITLWRAEVDNRPGALATTLAPVAQAGVDLKVVVGYRHPGAEGKAAIEVFPISARKRWRPAARLG